MCVWVYIVWEKAAQGFKGSGTWCESVLNVNLRETVRRPVNGGVFFIQHCTHSPNRSDRQVRPTPTARRMWEQMPKHNRGLNNSGNCCWLGQLLVARKDNSILFPFYASSYLYSAPAHGRVEGMNGSLKPVRFSFCIAALRLNSCPLVRNSNKSQFVSELIYILNNSAGDYGARVWFLRLAVNGICVNHIMAIILIGFIYNSASCNVS